MFSIAQHVDIIIYFYYRFQVIDSNTVKLMKAGLKKWETSDTPIDPMPYRSLKKDFCFTMALFILMKVTSYHLNFTIKEIS
jgi:hypothetical protein